MFAEIFLCGNIKELCKEILDEVEKKQTATICEYKSKLYLYLCSLLADGIKGVALTECIPYLFTFLYFPQLQAILTVTHWSWMISQAREA